MTAGQRRGVAVTGIGLTTAVGLGAAQTCASVRAGLAGFAEHASFAPLTPDPGWDDDEPLLCAAAPDLDPFLPGPARLVELASRALDDLVLAAGIRRRDLDGAALLLSLPPPDDVVVTWGLAELFARDLVRRAGLPPFKLVRVLCSGHTGMLELVRVAAALFEERAAERCLLLGVDTYLAADRLQLLDAARRIRSVRNVDGFLPGEAAAALLVEPVARAEARGADILAAVAAVGFGTEPRAAGSDRQSSGAGLCQALRALLQAGAEGRTPAWVLSDANGESYRAFEWGVAAARLGESLGRVRKLVHPADCYGDIGAATGGALLACAAAALRRGYAPADEATLICASDGGLRAAARVTR